MTCVHESPNVYQIRLPIDNEFAQPTNCFAVLDGGEALLVDVGAATERGLRFLNGALDELGVNRSRLTVALTHLHLDHSGLADRILPPGEPVLAGARSATVCDSDLLAAWRHRLESAFLREGATEADVACLGEPFYSSFAVPKSRPICFLSEEKRVTVGRYAFEVIETPGHTQGHIALFEPRSHLLISGDMLLFNTTSSVEYSADGTDDLQLYLDSLAKIRALECEIVLVAHGSSDGDCLARIDWLTKHNGEIADRMEHEVRLGQHLQGVDLVKRVYWPYGEEAWGELRPVRKLYILFKGFAVINHLAATGRIERIEGSRGTWKYRAR